MASVIVPRSSFACVRSLVIVFPRKQRKTERRVVSAATEAKVKGDRRIGPVGILSAAEAADTLDQASHHRHLYLKASFKFASITSSQLQATSASSLTSALTARNEAVANEHGNSSRRRV